MSKYTHQVTRANCQAAIDDAMRIIREVKALHTGSIKTMLKDSPLYVNGADQMLENFSLIRNYADSQDPQTGILLCLVCDDLAVSYIKEMKHLGERLEQTQAAIKAAVVLASLK